MYICPFKHHKQSPIQLYWSRDKAAKKHGTSNQNFPDE